MTPQKTNLIRNDPITSAGFWSEGNKIDVLLETAGLPISRVYSRI
jgi:hypothetical protein